MKIKKLFCLTLAFSLLIGLFVCTTRAETMYDAGRIEIPVIMSHKGVPVSETHTIELTANDDSLPMPNGKTGGSCTIQVDGEGTFHFPGIAYSKPGHYKYTLRQLAGNNPLAVSYDEGIYELTVYVYNMDEGLKGFAKMNRTGSEHKSDSASFVNTYVSPATATDDPKVSVSTGENTDDVFTYILTPYENSVGLAVNDMPMPEETRDGSKTIVGRNGMQIGFGTITFNQPGTYTYRVVQVNGNNDKYDYDNATYFITYTVTKDGDKLKYTYTITKDGNSADSINFINNPKKEEPAPTPEPEPELKGSFLPFCFNMSKQSKNSLTFKWKKVKGATKYAIYGNMCNTKKKQYKIKYIKTVASNKLTLKTAFGKKLKKGTYYKFYIEALDKNNKPICRSLTLHVATKGGKYGNHKKVKITSPKTRILVVKVGKTKKIKAKAVGKKVKVHVGLRYVSSNSQIATVDSKGKVKGKKKGTCTVYAYAQNGKYKTVKVVVK